ncbi:MAG: hypothetical protein AAF639_27820 [Chloroflexota bacterium]
MKDTDAALARILWIGGGTDAGKTTTSTILAKKLGVQVYHFDRSSSVNIAEDLGRAKAPRMMDWIEMTEDERWLLRSPDVIATHTFETFVETFPPKLAEILVMAQESVVIAEGFAFIPSLIEPLITHINQAIWMIPSETFRQESFKRRGKDQYRTRDGSSNPEVATQNHFNRDVLMAAQMHQEAEDRGLTWLTADGSRTPDEMAAVVETHFKPYLMSLN